MVAGEDGVAQSAGLHEVPAIVIEADNLKSLELAIIENVQRKDLNVIEEAESYKNLIQNFGYDHEKVQSLLVKADHISRTVTFTVITRKINRND